MDPRRAPYAKLEEEVRAEDIRRQKEDQERKTKLEQDQAKVVSDREAKVKIYDDDARTALQELEEDESAKMNALVARQGEELRELQQRQTKEQTARMKERDEAVRLLKEKNEGLRNDMLCVFKAKDEELIIKFKDEQRDLKFKREREDNDRRNKAFETVKAQSLFAADAASTGNTAPAVQAPGNQAVSLPPRPPSPERRRSRSRSPGLYRDRSPWRARERSPRGKARSPPRFRGDYHYQPSYDHYGPYSRPPSPRRDYYNTRPRSRSPPPYIPTGPRNWQPVRCAQSPRNGGRLDGRPLPVGRHKRVRTPSPVDKVTRETGDNVPKIPTGPRSEDHANKKPRFARGANKEPVKKRTLQPAKVSAQQGTMKKEAAPTPKQTNNNTEGAKPIGRYVAVDVPGPANGFLAHFPVQSVKYIEENGKLYEFVSHPFIATKQAELRLMIPGTSYKGFKPKTDSQYPPGWNITPGTIRQLLFWKKWGVVKVVKLKSVEDAGPKEVWIEFKEPKGLVLGGFLESFKKGWSLLKVYPEEGPDGAINPMIAFGKKGAGSPGGGAKK